MADSPNCTHDLMDIRRAELASLRERRQQVDLPTSQLMVEQGKPTDTVGLALSGGGLRSACFSLGIVQALFQTGLWRFVDYLSTVSGGGYIGGFLSSYVIHRGVVLTNENCPLLPRRDRDSRQPPDVQRFIYGGRYLVKPWEIANKFLIGLVFINATILLGLVAVCTVVALLWRSLDYDAIRNQAMLLGIEGFDGDVVSPFWPFFVFGVCWLTAWVVSYWRHGAEAPGMWARSLLLLLVVSLLIGLAVLFGNGDADLSFLKSVQTDNPWQPGNTFWATVLGLTLGGLVPFLAPKRLIQSGLKPKNDWERWAFALASIAALVGVPLLIISSVAREDFSGYNSHPHRPMQRGDFANQGTNAILELLWPRGEGAAALRRNPRDPETSTSDVRTARATNSGHDKVTSLMRKSFFGIDMDEVPAVSRGYISYKQDGVRPSPPRESVLKAAADVQAVWRDNNGQSWEDKFAHVLEEIEAHSEALKSIDKKTTANPPNMDSTLASEDKVELRLKLLIAVQEVELEWRAKRAAYLGTVDYVGIGAWLNQRVKTLTVAFQHFFWSGDSENDATELLTLHRFRNRLQVQLANAINDDVLLHGKSSPKSRELLYALVESHTATSTAESVDGRARSTGKRDRRRDELVKRAVAENVELWLPFEVFELKTLLFEAQFPQAFRSRFDPQRRTTHEQDQKSRWFVFCGSLLMFLLLGISLDLNATSMHRFYRSCITKAFIVPQRNKSESPALSELTTTRLGAPYHLMSASTGLALDRTGNENIPAGQDFEPDAEPIYRVIDSFLFSQRFCGSQITGYAKTDEYEKWIHGAQNRIDLAEAVAISGAAVSPSNIRNWLVAFLMFVLNFRLGQWVPNPRQGRPRWRPTLLTLLPKMRLPARQRDYCFVSDGGNSENLGLVQLLRRKCTLILQIDAGQDEDHCFADLGRAIRTARIHGGVRLVQLEDPDLDFTTDSLHLSVLDGSWSDTVTRNCKHHFSAAKILYPDGTEGLLIYIKPSFTGDESRDLQQYRRRNPDFPHEPTSEQVYDKERAESYRQLGYHIASVICRPLTKNYVDLWRTNLTTADLCRLLIPSSFSAPTPPEQAAGVPPSDHVDEVGTPAGAVAGQGGPGLAATANSATDEMSHGGSGTEITRATPQGLSDAADQGPTLRPESVVALASTCLDRLQPPEDKRLEAVRRLLKLNESAILGRRDSVQVLIYGLTHDPAPNVRYHIIELLELLYPHAHRRKNRILKALMTCGEQDPVSRIRKRALRNTATLPQRKGKPR